VAKPAEDPLVAQAFDAKARHEELARAIAQLSPDEAAHFLHKLERGLRKRKIELAGYLTAMAVWLVAMVVAMVYFGTHDGSAIWVFALPFGLVGAVLYGFGSWGKRIASTPLEPPGDTAAVQAPPQPQLPPQSPQRSGAEPAEPTAKP
jgi:hypothetical protein